MEQCNKKRYSLGEEIFNSVSHGVGTLLAIAGCVVIIVMAAIHCDALSVVSVSIYGATMIILYLMSTLYHALANPKAKEVFRVFDHLSIFLLISGTYTPYTLITLRGKTGYILFGIIWACAIIGITFNAINLKKYEKISTLLYLIMGWAIIFAIKPLLAALQTAGIVFLVLGGVMYTLGVIFFILKKYKYMHSVWHLFVLAGSIFHYFSILFYVVL